MYLRIALRHFGRKPIRPASLPDSVPNYNFEQHRGYTERFEKAVENRELLIKKASDLKSMAVPKKKARIRKEISDDISNYDIWRTFNEMYKPNRPTETPEYQKETDFKCAPADLVRAFGQPILPRFAFARSTGIYEFSDSNLDTFWIYDYHLQIEFLTSNKKTSEWINDFWSSEEPAVFRVSHTTYAERMKFMNYVKQHIAKVKSGEVKTYDEIAEEKLGKIEWYDDYDATYEHDMRRPPVYRYHRNEIESVTPSAINIDDQQYEHEIKEPPNLLDDPEAKRLTATKAESKLKK